MADALQYVLDWLDANGSLDAETRTHLRRQARRIDAREAKSRHKVAIPGGPPSQHVWVEGDAIRLTLWFPRSQGSQQRVHLDLVDAVPADPLSIRYDFERDGWVIEQASQFEFDFDVPEEERDPDFQEVAFVKAWARREPEE